LEPKEASVDKLIDELVGEIQTTNGALIDESTDIVRHTQAFQSFQIF
jgi:hypothetical protein